MEVGRLCLFQRKNKETIMGEKQEEHKWKNILLYAKGHYPVIKGSWKDIESLLIAQFPGEDVTIEKAITVLSALVFRTFEQADIPSIAFAELMVLMYKVVGSMPKEISLESQMLELLFGGLLTVLACTKYEYIGDPDADILNILLRKPKYNQETWQTANRKGAKSFR